MKYASEAGGTFLHIKSGVLTIYAVGEKENTHQLTIFEILHEPEYIREIYRYAVLGVVSKETSITISCSH